MRCIRNDTFMQIRVHPVQRYSSRQERETLACKPDRSRQNAPSSQRAAELKSCTEHIAVTAIGDLPLSRCILFFFFIPRIMSNAIVGYNPAALSQNIPRYPYLLILRERALRISIVNLIVPSYTFMFSRNPCNRIILLYSFLYDVTININMSSFHISFISLIFYNSMLGNDIYLTIIRTASFRSSFCSMSNCYRAY